MTMSHKVTPTVNSNVFNLVSEGNILELNRISETFGNAFIKERDETGSTLLHCATADNQTVVMNYLIENGINLNATDKDGNTALHIAVQRELIDAIHILLDRGAKDNILNKEGKAPLHIACAGENSHVLAALLKHDIDIGVVGYQKCTPMHIIAEHDNLEGCKLFHSKIQSAETKAAFCLDLPNENGYTPCHLAAQANSFQVLEFIIQNCKSYGYPVEIVLGNLDKENSTPLHTAVDKGNTEVIEILLQYGASPTCTNHIVPPLHLACSQGKMGIVQRMVDYAGEEILTQPDLNGKTPLHYCAYSVSSGSIASFIAQLETHEKKVIDNQDDDGMTPLHKAVELGNLTVTRSLISLGANPLTLNNSGDNVLHIATRKRHKFIIKELLQLSCVTELCIGKNHSGFAAIHVALKSGDSDVISTLMVDDKLHQTIMDKEGNNYLHLAAESGNKRALKVLLNSSIGRQQLNNSNNSGITPLHLAARSGNSSCVHLLLRRGAMVHKCNHGVTPLMIACKGGHTECARLLHEAHPFQINWKNNEGNTALHFAAKSKTPSTIRQILNVSSSTVCQNANGETFFDLIIASKNQESAMAVVNHDRWQECIDSSSGPGSTSHSHPMISLIKVMPEVAQAILNRCHMKSSNYESRTDYDGDTFDFKYVNCTHISEATTSAQIVHGRNESATKNDEIYYEGGNKQNGHQKQHAVPSMKVLQTMIKHKRVSLLGHPVVSAYLKMKWNNYGTPFYISSFIILVLLVAFMSAFILTVPNPSQQVSFTNLMENVSNDSNLTVNNSSSPADLSTSAQAFRVVVLVLNVLLTVHFIMTTTGLGLYSLNCIRYIHKWVYAFGLICNYMFFLAPNPLDIWPVGSVACFLSWFMLILSMEFFGALGLYVEMFTTVLRTVIQVLFICFFLLMAFAFSFYVLAGSFSDFSTIGYSLFTMIGYMVGDISFGTFVTYDIEDSRYGNYVLIFVVLVSLIVTIVMVNLLVGLAVGDIERVKHNATLQQRTAEIELFSSIDRRLPRQILCRLNHPTYTNPSYKQSSRFKKILSQLGQVVGEDISSTFENTQTSNDRGSNVMDDETKQELADVKTEIIKLKEILQQLQFVGQSSTDHP